MRLNDIRGEISSKREERDLDRIDDDGRRFIWARSEVRGIFGN